MHIDAKPLDLKLTTPFRISRGVQYTSPNAIIEVNHDDYTGYGEASPTEYYGESVETVFACITSNNLISVLRSRPLPYFFKRFS